MYLIEVQNGCTCSRIRIAPGGRPKLHSWGGYFRPFITLKSLCQDPSNNFILSLRRSLSSYAIF